MSDFKIGDTVQLKSGGPVMTVSNIGKDMGDTPTVWVDWFEKSEPKRATFHPEQLISA